MASRSSTPVSKGVWESIPPIIQRTFSVCPDAAAKLVILIDHNLRLALEPDEDGKIREDRKIWIHVAEDWLGQLKLIAHPSWKIKDIGNAFKTCLQFFMINRVST
jgi:hypothetical protein